MQAKPQLVPSHVDVAFDGGVHMVVQLPHDEMLVRSVSHPLPTDPSQFCQLASQDAIWQVSVEHVPVALGGSHRTLQPPQ